MLPAVVTEDDQCSTEEALADVAAEADLTARIEGWLEASDYEREELRGLEKRLEGVVDPAVLEVAAEAINQKRWALLEILAEASDGRYETADVFRWVSRSTAKGAAFPVVARTMIEDLARYRKVPNEPLREAAIDHLDESGRTWYELAESAGFTGARPQHGTSLLQYHLGVVAKPASRQGQAPSCPFLMPYENAVALALTIGITPQQAGV